MTHTVKQNPQLIFLGRSDMAGQVRRCVDGSGVAFMAFDTPANARKTITASLAAESIPLLLIDLESRDMDAAGTIRELREVDERLRIIGLVERPSMRPAIEAIKAGARQVVHLAAETGLLEQEIEYFLEMLHQEKQQGELLRQNRARYDFTNIIGHKTGLREVIELLSRICQRTWVTVLLLGETGTGKELIARAIHYNSFPGFRPFVEVNCGALPETLLESELFGHEKGAFTDARTLKKGLFEVAENGTLFLDEIGEISPTVQVKLLRALEEKRIRRLGGTKDIQVKTRIIAATNRDLQAAIHAGHFRADLYYRLNVVSVHLPPLRERGDDVVLLARHFARRFAAEYRRTITGFTPEAEQLLKAYPWPGNVRELQHTIERICLLGRGVMITQTDLLDSMQSESTLPMTGRGIEHSIQIVVPPEGLSLEEGEKKIIAAMLEKTNWNKRQAARMLGISRPRLDRKIERYRLGV